MGVDERSAVDPLTMGVHGLQWLKVVAGTTCDDTARYPAGRSGRGPR